MDYGFKVVLSSRFADIFRGNSGKAGLLAAQVTQDVVEQLWKLIETEPEHRDRRGPARSAPCRPVRLTAPFQIDDYTRWRLLEGLDDIGITLSHEDDIATYEASTAGLEARHALRRCSSSDRFPRCTSGNTTRVVVVTAVPTFP